MAVFLMGLQVATDRCATINDRSDAPARPRLWGGPEHRHCPAAHRLIVRPR